MPRYICKLVDPINNQAYYMDWSTIVDAPVTNGMSLEEFKEYYRDEYGRAAFEFHFERRMELVETNGTSAHAYASVDEVISNNRAGKDGTSYTKEQIIEWYCKRYDEYDNRPEGTRINYEDDE